jgi:hypothetical protein
MKIKIKPIEKPDKDWDKRATLMGGGSIYQTKNYADIQEKCLDMKSEYLLAYKDSKLVGQLIVIYGPRFAKYLNRGNMKLFNFFLKHFKIYTFIEGPIILDKNSKKEIYSAFLDHLDLNKKKCFMARELSLPIGEEKEIYNLFYNKKFHADSWGTVIINVRQPVGNLWKNIGKKRRNLIRKGRKLNLIVKEIKEKKDYDLVVSIIREKAKRNNIFHYNEKYYQNFFKIFIKENMGKIWIVKKGRMPLATITTYLFGKNVIQSDVAHSDYCAENKIPATDFLEWHIIKWAHEKGYSTYDLSGIRPESKEQKHISMKHYKTTWGGKEIYFPYFFKYYSKTKKVLLNTLNISRNFLIKSSSN